MRGTADFYNSHDHYLKEKEHYESVLRTMAERLRHRGPDDAGQRFWKHGSPSHARLSIIDLTGGHQPVVKSGSRQTFAIACNGELYNTDKLRQEPMAVDYSFQTSSGTEVILAGYMEYGPDFIKRLNDIFAFAIMDTIHSRLHLLQDWVGVKPLFYTTRDEELIFSPEFRRILAYPDTKVRLDRRGLNEVFFIGPARTYGCGILKDIQELLPEHYLIYGSDGIRQQSHWKLIGRPHEGSHGGTIEKTSFLVEGPVRRQMTSDVPIHISLLGGVDSSPVSAICAKELKKQRKRLTTFSFDLADNNKLFRINPSRPSRDRPYVDQMVRFLDSDYHYLECGNLIQTDRPFDSVLAYDLPAVRDIDSSVLQFYSMVGEHNKVTPTGECTDEISGDCPWFHKKECLKTRTFPWTMDLSPRKSLLDDSLLGYLNMSRYVVDTYERSVAETPVLAEDSLKETRHREITWLNLRWLMQVLLNRMDRTSIYPGLEARVPFVDHRVIEYIWNVPQDMKTRDGLVKNLLHQSGKGFLLDEILFRKKSPYPKTYDTAYKKLLADRVRRVMGDSHSPVMDFLDQKKLVRLLISPSDYGEPWYGRLTAGPQMLAYILRVNFWLKVYGIEVMGQE